VLVKLCCTVKASGLSEFMVDIIQDVEVLIVEGKIACGESPSLLHRVQTFTYSVS
jgi:hypothetical protein